MTTTTDTDTRRVTVTFTKTGTGAGHAAYGNLRPLCGANLNKPSATPQVQAEGWEAVTCKRCRKAVDTLVEQEANELQDEMTERARTNPNDLEAQAFLAGEAADNVLVFLDMDGTGTGTPFPARREEDEHGVYYTFTRETAEAVVEWTNERAEYDDETPILEWSGDVLMHHVPEDGPYGSEYHADEHGRYAVGGDHGWDWQPVNPEGTWRNDAPDEWTFHPEDPDAYRSLRGTVAMKPPHTWSVGYAGPFTRSDGEVYTGTAPLWSISSQHAGHALALLAWRRDHDK